MPHSAPNPENEEQDHFLVFSFLGNRKVVAGDVAIIAIAVVACSSAWQDYRRTGVG